MDSKTHANNDENVLPPEKESQPTVRNISKNTGQAITQRVLELLMNSIDNEQFITQVKSKFVHPVLHSVFTQLYPYLMFLTILMIAVLILNLLCCSVFIMNAYFYKKRSN